MTFEENKKAIYLQIEDRICDEIMRGIFNEDERIPSVREYAADLEVNPNTVMRSYERLTIRGLIFNKRGLGFFVSPDAKRRIILERREELMSKQLPAIFSLMKNLSITPGQLAEEYEKYLNGNK